MIKHKTFSIEAGIDEAELLAKEFTNKAGIKITADMIDKAQVQDSRERDCFYKVYFGYLRFEKKGSANLDNGVIKNYWLAQWEDLRNIRRKK